MIPHCLPDHLTRHRPSQRALDRLYPVPNECLSLLDWHRARHRDLPGLADHALTVEGRRVSNRLDFETDRYVRDWLLCRVDAIVAERRRRVAR